VAKQSLRSTGDQLVLYKHAASCFRSVTRSDSSEWLSEPRWGPTYIPRGRLPVHVGCSRGYSISTRRTIQNVQFVPCSRYCVTDPVYSHIHCFKECFLSFFHLGIIITNRDFRSSDWAVLCTFEGWKFCSAYFSFLGCITLKIHYNVDYPNFSQTEPSFILTTYTGALVSVHIIPYGL